MKTIKQFGIIAALLTIVAPVALMATEADAATARARCRVAGTRVRIQVDGQDLDPGVYSAILRNLTTTATAATTPGKEKTATELNPDVDLDFDSTAGTRDVDSFISPTFARVGNQIKADVVTLKNGVFVTVASASNRCTQ